MKTYRLDSFAPLRVLATMLVLAAAPHASGEARLGTTTVKVGVHPLRVEVVKSDDERSRGLMFRQKLGRDDGMLFIFDEPGFYRVRLWGLVPDANDPTGPGCPAEPGAGDAAGSGGTAGSADAA